MADHLRCSILTGDLASDARIMQEEIATSLQASRLPVREAMRRLGTEGLVVLKATSGAWISKLDMAECEGIYKMRDRLEHLALAESIPHLTGADVLKLEEIQDGIERTTDVDVFLSLDRELHLATCAGCPIQQLTTMVQRYRNTTQHYRRAFARIIDDAGWKVIIKSTI
ncbi:GntR family transcriptional regulator [Streptomyces violaceusniger]|uniref:GntR family transcriptional regulator n=1 Tax=Streptomyces violaceusniger TaxID=68280 RepID=UPI001F339E1F|nr:GntR family transcriptional regulator [Streptomyces hygroscopicus]